MLSSSVLLVALLTMPSQAGRSADEAAFAPLMDIPQCFVPDVEPDATYIIDVKDAPEGGSWWLQREGEYAQLLAVSETLELRAGNGSTVDVELEVREGAVRIPVPDQATNGDSFLLVSTITDDSLVLRVAEVPFVDELVVEFVELSVQGVDQMECFVDCTREGQTVPRAPTVDIAYWGGPSAVTVRYDTDGFMPNGDPGRPLVRDLILEHSPAPRVVTLTVAPFIEGPASGSATIEIVPLHGGEPHVETIETAEVEEVPFEGEANFMQSCDEVYEGGYYDQECACTHGGAGRPLAGILAGLLLVGLARKPRRRRGLRP